MINASLFFSALLGWILAVGALQICKAQARMFWQHIQDLEADKRALTESLCRAQGKPYISSEKREFKPSDGWFDGATIIKVPEA